MNLIKKAIFTGIFLTTSLNLAAMERPPREAAEDVTLCTMLSQVITTPPAPENFRQIRMNMNLTHKRFTKITILFAERSQGRKNKKTLRALEEIRQEITTALTMALGFLTAGFGSYEGFIAAIKEIDPAVLEDDPVLSKALRIKHFVDELGAWLQHNTPADPR